MCPRDLAPRMNNAVAEGDKRLDLFEVLLNGRRVEAGVLQYLDVLGEFAPTLVLCTLSVVCGKGQTREFPRRLFQETAKGRKHGVTECPINNVFRVMKSSISLRP